MARAIATLEGETKMLLPGSFSKTSENSLKPNLVLAAISLLSGFDAGFDIGDSERGRRDWANALVLVLT
jgi:hypothetical protein